MLIWKIDASIKEDTRNIVHRAPVPFKVGTLGPHTVFPVPSAALSYFPESHQQSEIPSLFKVILVWGKVTSCRALNLGCRGAKPPGWFAILPKKSAWDVMHEQAYCDDEAANHQLPAAVAFWIIWIVSAEECSNLMQNLMQVHCSTRSVILNAVTTQYTRSLNGVYRPHWLDQYSEVVVHAHSSPLSLAASDINVMWTILVILTTKVHSWTFSRPPHHEHCTSLKLFIF